MSSIPPSTPEPFAAQRQPNPATLLLIRRCPECDGPVVRASGCLCCQQCGWGRCG
jgi:hypothetical protein